MLWLCVHLPKLALEALPSEDPALTVTDQRGSQRWIVASRLALAPGTPLAAALAIEPSLRAVPRRIEAERAQLKSLASAAYRYSGQVTAQRIEAPGAFGLPQHRLWLELGASLRLFGGLPALLAEFSAELAAHAYALGLAPTLDGAALLARAEISRPVETIAQLERVIAPLPLSLLGLDEAAAAVLRGAGLARIGEVLALPRAALARRFGADCLARLDRLLGRAPDPRKFVKPPARFERRFELLGEVESTETLRFPLRRLFAEFESYLRARDTGAEGFTLAFEHARAAPTVLRFALVAPSRSAAHFLLLARERFEREVLPAPVHGLALSARQFATPEAPQLDLFGETLQREGQWRALLEKLQARLGESAVFGLDLTEDHRPERAWTARSAPSSARAGGGVFVRPAWLLREPQPLAHAPRTGLENVERIESGWWDGPDVRRQYYTVRSRDGARLWVFQDLATQRWYLHGLWA